MHTTGHFNKAFMKSVIDDVEWYGAGIKSDFLSPVNFSIDSRTLNAGEIFVAVKGTKNDGHDFIKEAVEKGASGLIIAKDSVSRLDELSAGVRQKLIIAVVPDTKIAMLSLARVWRAKFDYPVIGITGSVGKTMTKELLSQILSRAGKSVISTYKHQNTELGCALNVLRLTNEHDVALVEMGVRRRGEMARMADIVRPTSAIITTIGHSHMEGLGSVSDIASEKRDIFKHFKEDGIGIINGDQALLASISYPHPIVKFGCKMTNQVQARKIQAKASETSFTLKLYKDKRRVTMQTNHMGPIMNGLAAATAAHLLGVATDTIVVALEEPCNVRSRFEARNLKGGRGLLIDDCYDANPESMKAALLAFERMESEGKKIAILGDMLELGVNAPFWHRQLGRFLRKVSSLSHVVFVGENVKWAQKTLPPFITSELVANWQEAKGLLKKHLEKKVTLLVKGSEPIGLDNLVDEVAE